MKVTIGGRSGSGKTTIAKIVAERLGFKHYSMGDIRGRMAMEMGVTVDETGEDVDIKLDQQAKKIGETEDDFVMDTWMGFHFVPNSIKIFLDASLEAGAKRIFKNQRPDEERQNTVEGLMGMIRKRMEDNQKRWLRLYNIDYLDMKHYDFVLDTSNLRKKEVVQKVLDYLESKKQSL